MPFALPGHEVHVHYRLTDSISADEQAQALETLSSDEQERAARFLFPRHRVTFITAHWLLRTALSRYEDVRPSNWTFAVNAHGKPFLCDRHSAIDLRFNLAHTDGLIACAVCRGAEVGVDVESLGRQIPSLELAARYFSASEVTSLQACHESARDAHFIELWTLKEAYVKAIGAGLSHPLSSFSVLFNGSSSLRFEPATREQSMWQFALFAPSAGHRMAVAVPCATREPRQITTRVSESDTTAATVLRTSVP